MKEKKEMVFKIINDIREEKDENALHGITEATSLRKDAGFDSIDLAVLTARIDAECGIDIFADGIVDTVGEVLEKLM